MKIEVGKFYRTRDGEKVGPMRNDWPSNQGWNWHYDGDGTQWGSDGLTMDRFDRDMDLIAEWTDAAPEVSASSANQGPVREVTTVRKEIVPGGYGPLTIRATDELGPVQLEINGSVGRTWFSKSDVDALLTTLTAIRDAMSA